MPGLNQSGQGRKDSRTGRQRGMCKRTKDLPLQTGSGRGMGRRIQMRLADLQLSPRKGGGLGQQVQEGDIAADLDELKKQYEEKAIELEKLAIKIQSLEK